LLLADSFVGSLFELKMEPVCSSEILVNFYWTTWCFVPGESTLLNQYWWSRYKWFSARILEMFFPRTLQVHSVLPPSMFSHIYVTANSLFHFIHRKGSTEQGGKNVKFVIERPFQ
jgi:hypothetical protein